MTSGADKNDETNAPDGGIFALIERAAEFKWMLQLTAFGLFVDTALIVTRSKNILTFPWSQIVWVSEIGHAIVLGISFSILVAAVLPLTEIVIGNCVRHLYFSLPITFSTSENFRRPHNHVSLSELRHQADREQSEYLLAKCHRVEAQIVESENLRSKIQRSAFRVLALLTLNLCAGTEALPSTVQAAIGLVQRDTYLLVLCLIYLGLLTICCQYWWRDAYSWRWVAYAPLYEEIENRRRKSLRDSRRSDLST